MFRDSWLSDFVQWEMFTAGGGCACCVVPQQSHANVRVQEYVKQCPDVDLAVVCADVERSTWQQYMLEETWRDRVVFRRIVANKVSTALAPTLKRCRKEFKAFWASLSTAERVDCLRVPEATLVAEIEDKFESTSLTLMRGVLRQIINFSQTGYVPDAAAAGDSHEEVFEGSLLWLDGDATVSEAFADLLAGTDGEGCVSGGETGDGGFFCQLEALVKDPQEEILKVPAVVPRPGDAIPGSMAFWSDRRLFRRHIFVTMASQAVRLFKQYRAARRREQFQKELEAAQSASLGGPARVLDSTKVCVALPTYLPTYLPTFLPASPHSVCI